MQRTCGKCGNEYTAKNSRSRYCSDLCRAKASKAPKAAVIALPESVPSGSVYASTLAELTAGGVAESSLGAAALEIARRVDNSTGESISSLSAGVRELRATMAEALKDAKVKESPLDQLRARRDAKRSAG